MNDQPASSAVRIADVIRWGRSGRCAVAAGDDVFFLPYVIPGERIRLLLDTTGNVPHLAEILEPSRQRAAETCPDARRCPGCTLRHLAYPYQLEQLEEHVMFALRRERISPPPEPVRVIPYPTPRSYRIRTRLRVFRHRAGAVTLGMPAHPGAGKPVDLTRCPNHHPYLNRAAAAIRDALRSSDAPDILEIRVDISPNNPGTSRVILIIPPDSSGVQRHRIDDFIKHLPPGTGVFLQPITHRAGQPSRRPPVHIAGTETLPLRHAGIRFDVPAGVWTPVSEHAAALLTEFLRKTIGNNAGNQIIEIGCGIGLQSIPAAQAGFAITGIDENGAAVQTARRTATALNLPPERTRYRQGRAEPALRRLAGRGYKADIAILHGMRRPYGNGVIRLLPSLNIRRLILLSPSPRAIATDAAAALTTGFRWESLTLIDQIPHTTAVLSAAVFRR